MGPRWLERIRLYEHINLCLVLPKSFNSQHWASTLNNYDICIPRQSWSKVVCFLLGRRFPLQTCTRLPGREGGEKLWAHAPKTCLLGGKKLTFCIKSFNTWTAFKKRRTALSTGQSLFQLPQKGPKRNDTGDIEPSLSMYWPHKR